MAVVVTLALLLIGMYALGAVFAAGVAIAARRAWRLTGLPFLGSFFLALVLIEVSYLFVLLNRVFGRDLTAYHDTLWVHAVTQLAAFALLGLAYSGHARTLSAGSARRLHAAGGVAIAATIAGFLVLPGPVAWPWRMPVSGLLYAGGLLLVGFAVARAALAVRVSAQARAPWVPAGLALWGVSQVAWVAWGLTDARAALFAANAAHVMGLFFLAYALRGLGRERP
jgi:hypothetical protein